MSKAAKSEKRSFFNIRVENESSDAILQQKQREITVQHAIRMANPDRDNIKRKQKDIHNTRQRTRLAI
jgi:hypothetical protein